MTERAPDPHQPGVTFGLRERLAVPGVVGPEGDHHLARGQRPLLMRVHDEALPNQAPPAVYDCPALHS